VCAARWYRLARYRARSCSCVCSFVCVPRVRVVRGARVERAARFVSFDAGTIAARGAIVKREIGFPRGLVCARVRGSTLRGARRSSEQRGSEQRAPHEQRGRARVRGARRCAGAGLRERERGRARVRSCAGSERGRGSTVERGRYRRTRASTRARIAASPRAGIAGGLVRFNRSGAGSCGARSIPARIAPPSSAGLLATIGGRSLALLVFVFVCSCVCYPRSCVWCVWRALRAPFHWSKPRPAEAGAGLW